MAQGTCVAGNGMNDTINFILLSPGVQTIAPGSALPAITRPVTINGYSQPGASMNTNPLATGDNAVILIQLDGTGAGHVSGLTINPGVCTVASPCLIEGLSITNFNGIGILLNSGNTTVAGNFIGTNPAGATAFPNVNGVGITGGASGNTVGGTTAGARNIIAGNSLYGVFIQSSGTTGNVVEGNYIGTDVTGVTPVANTFAGVNILGSASGNTIGGTTAGARNLISGNSQYSVVIQQSGTSSNVIEGNDIGTDVSGGAALPNAIGVIIINGATNNTIGGTAAGAGNTNAFNGRTTSTSGVVIGGAASDTTTVNNAVLGNAIYDNGGAAGIDLALDGVTPNSANPRAFPNDGQNFPVLTAAYGSTVTGTLDSVPSASFRLEFFATPSGTPGGRNGQTFLGFVTGTTDGSGHLAFTFTAPGALPAGAVIAATATNTTAGPQLNDTSEFAAPLVIPSGIAATGGTPQSTLVNHIFAMALTARVTDSTGAGLANIPVVFTAPASGASGTFAAEPGCTLSGGGAVATCLTNVGGIATSPIYKANAVAGADTVVASVPGPTPTASFLLQNLAPVTISPATLPAGTVGASYSQVITAAGGSGFGYLFTSGTLPAGLTLSPGGVLTGTPAAAGTSTFTVVVTYTLTINAAPLTGIALTGPGGATAPTLKVGQSAPLTATGMYADHSTQPIPTGQLQWQSSNPAVATVDASGTVQGISPGTVTITGTFNGVQGQIAVTVAGPTPVGIMVPPAPANRPSGATSAPGTAPAPAPVPTGR